MPLNNKQKNGESYPSRYRNYQRESNTTDRLLIEFFIVQMNIFLEKKKELGRYQVLPTF